MREPETPAQDQLMREAAAWFARMRGPEAEASREEFEAWLRRGALHRSAYNRASEIFAMGKLLAPDAPAAPEPTRRGRYLAPAAIAALIGAGILCSLAYLASSQNDLAAGPKNEPGAAAESAGIRLTSGPEETRLVRLADGSRVALGPGTLLEVRLGIAERRLDLGRGHARFNVFHEARPFVVRAGGGRVTALGTLFDVALSSDRRVQVRLIEGALAVDLPPPPEGKPLTSAKRLTTGESLSFPAQPEKTFGKAQPRNGGGGGDAPALLSAREYRDVSVAELVAAANRGAPRPIVLTEAATGQIRVSGRFRIDDTVVLAERLALLFDLSIERGRSGEILLRAS